MIARDPARGIRKFMIAFCIAVMLLTAALVVVARAAPDGFSAQASIGCSVRYLSGGQLYKFNVQGSGDFLNTPIIYYDVYQFQGNTWVKVLGYPGYVQPGVETQENAIVPRVTWLNSVSVQLWSLDKTMLDKTCMIYMAGVRN